MSPPAPAPGALAGSGAEGRRALAGSANFPTTECAFQTYYGGGSSDAFVTKWSADGGALLFSSFLGGTCSDRGDSIAVDAAGSAFLSGETLSSDFPTMNPFQRDSGGGADAFIARIAE